MRYLLIASFIVLFLSCKKDPTETDPTPQPVTELTLITSVAVPGQVVVAQSTTPITKDSAQISVNGTMVLAAKADSNRIVFIMPELPAGSTAVIQYANIGINKQLNVTVGNYTVISNPDNIISDYTTKLDKLIQNYLEYQNSPLIPLDPEYVNLLKYCRNNLLAKINTLSSEVKRQFAYTINFYTVDTSGTKIGELNDQFFARMTQMLGDPEDEFKKNTSELITKVAEARQEIALGYILMIGASSTGPAAVLVALGGATIFLRGVIKMTDAQANSYAKSINAVAIRTLGIQVNRITADTIVFPKDIERKTIFKGMFRTVVSDDMAGGASIMSDFKKGKLGLDECRSFAMNAFAKFKQFMGGGSQAFPASNSSLSSIAKSVKIAMQASKLNVSNISDPRITVNVIKEDTSMLIKMSSSTIVQTTPFTFDITYTNSSTGSIVTDRVNAIFKVREASLLKIISGNNQSAPATYSLANPLTVEVRDDSGKVMEGVPVQWAVSFGGGQLLMNTTTTGSTGTSTNGWQLGASGTQLVTVTVKKPDGTHVSGSPASFSATIKEPASIVMVSGNYQSGPINTNLPFPLTVKVNDANGQPMNGIAVYWTVTSGNGQLSAAVSNTTANGQASTTWQLGSSGNQTVTAVAKKSDGSNVSGSPITFTATFTGVGTTLVTLAGSGPVHIVVDQAGNVYYSEEYMHRVMKLAPGSNTPVVFAGGNGAGNAANQLRSPKGIDLDASGNLYIADYGNNRIQMWAPNAASGITVIKSYSAVVGGIREPQDVQVGSGGMLFISLDGGVRVEKRAVNATSGVTVVGPIPGSEATMYRIHVDGGDNVYVSDKTNNLVKKYAPNGSMTIVAGGNGGGWNSNQLSNPVSTYVDGAGSVYVADQANHRIQKWAPGASAGVTVAGGNGPGGANNQVDTPSDVYVDAAGKIYIVEYNGIRKW
jgi:streptogramin lyase